MPLPYGEAVTVLPYEAGTEDAHGNPVDSWAEDGETYPGCAIDSLSSEPVEAGRDAVVDTGKIYGPFDMAVSPRDHVEFRGDTWEVIGTVWREQNPYTGWRPGCWFAIRRERG